MLWDAVSALGCCECFGVLWGAVGCCGVLWGAVGAVCGEVRYVHTYFVLVCMYAGNVLAFVPWSLVAF